MAITGKYTFRGIDIDDAYVKVDNANFSHHEAMEEVVKTAAVYNTDGSIKTAAVMEYQAKKSTPGYCVARIYKDKATRDADYNNYVSQENLGFDVDLKASAKNLANQAYVALKASDKFKDYTDV